VLGGALACAMLAACGLLVLPASHGDAAIYFNYFKRFFTLPFSFQPGTVAYGATSPLHTLLFAGVYQLAGDAWYLTAKLVNLALVGLGIREIARALGRPHALLTVAALALAFRTLWLAAAQLFEVGLTFALVAVFVARYGGGGRLAHVVAGLLPAVRPELVLITLVAGIDTAARRGVRALGWLLAGASVPAVYVLYMAASGAGWVPSSAANRVLRAHEGEAQWWARLLETLEYLRAVDPAYLWALPATLVGLLLVRERRGAALAFLPLLAVFVAVPTQAFAPRYLVPLIPAVLLVLPALFWQACARLSSRTLVPLAVVIGFGAWQLLGHHARRAEYARYDLPRWLLTDLTQQLNPRLSAPDGVLIYEIQSQYGMEGRAISADGTVGREVTAMLAGEEPAADFLRRLRIRYVVTSNAFAYRPQFDDTLFEALYAHDLDAPVGAELTRDGMRFRKLFTNPSFADPARHFPVRRPGLNHGTTIRMYGDEHWFGYSILWNSVYEVVDDAPA